MIIFQPGEMIDERSIVNGIVGLMATGGSTNHTLHIPAIAAAAGISVTQDDFADLSAVVPLLARVYPNGPADVNHFHASGGMGFVVRELVDAGLLHGDAKAVSGTIAEQSREPWLDGDELSWRDAPSESDNLDILRPASDPFSSDGGLRLMQGPIGRGVSKVSAVKEEHRNVKRQRGCLTHQQAMKAAFEAGELNGDFVAVVRFQGPAANGMPELHSLTPTLGVLQDRGHKVALVTDGRMSGASGKVPSAIHIGPEAARGGPIARIRDGDVIRLDASTGVLTTDADLMSREPAVFRPNEHQVGLGRELFSLFRAGASDAEHGASPFALMSTVKSPD